MSEFTDLLRAEGKRLAESELPSAEEVRAFTAALAARLEAVETKVLGRSQSEAVQTPEASPHAVQPEAAAAQVEDAQQAQAQAEEKAQAQEQELSDARTQLEAAQTRVAELEGETQGEQG